MQRFSDYMIIIVDFNIKYLFPTKAWHKNLPFKKLAVCMSSPIHTPNLLIYLYVFCCGLWPLHILFQRVDISNIDE